MGLDMFAFRHKGEMTKEQVHEAKHNVDVEEIAYWRKHNRLQGWFENLFYKKHDGKEISWDAFNCVPLYLSRDDLMKLREDVSNKRLPETEGFFFDSAKSVRPPRLRGMLGYIEVEIEEPFKPQGADNPLEFECRIKEVDAPSRLPQIHSRARFAAIESVIHATRIVALVDSDPNLTERLYELIQHYHGLVHRIAPNSIHSGVVDDVLYLVQRLVYWL